MHRYDAALEGRMALFHRDDGGISSMNAKPMIDQRRPMKSMPEVDAAITDCINRVNTHAPKK